MENITDSDELFVPMNGEAKRDELLIKKLFSKEKTGPDFFLHQIADFGTWAEINFLTCQNNAGSYPNILDQKFLEKIQNINELLLEKSVLKVKNKTISFYDICAKQNGNCLIDGSDLLSPSFYRFQLSEFMRKKDLKIKEAKIFNKYDNDNKVEANEFRFYINGQKLTELTYNLGKHFYVNSYNESDNGKVPAHSRFFKLRYNLESNAEHTLDEVKLWEKEFLKNMLHFFKNNETFTCESKSSVSMRVSYSVSESLNMELESNIQMDSIFVGATFILLMIVATLLMSLNSTCITSPGIFLPMAGMLSAIFGVSSAFGFLSIIGYPACNLIYVIPFLVFGVGIDDMFIIYSSFKRALYQSEEKFSISVIMSKSLSKSGVSITITSLTDFTAFMIGMTTDFRSVQIFCIYVAFSILFCYIYQLTIFAGCLCIHAYRIKNKRNSFLMCIKQEKLPSFCAEKDTLHAVDKESFNSKFKNIFKKILEFIITKPFGKGITIFVFIIYISVSSWSAYQITEGLNLADLVSDKSYYKTYINDNTGMIDLNPIIMFVIYEPIDYDRISTRIKIKKLFSNAQKMEDMSKTFSLNWLENFGDGPLNYKDNPDEFKMNLKFFPPFINDVVIEKIKNNVTNKFEHQITASRFYLQYEELHFNSKDAIPMTILRRLCRESGLPVIAYSMPFKFYEQFESTLPNIVQTFIISTEAMYLIALIFIPDLISVFLITFTMFSIMIGLLSAMNLMSLSLSSITMIIVIMSIGFCIDFSAHVVHAFIGNCGKGTRNERALNSVFNIGLPIFYSALSTFVGISLLYFCESFIFKAFFKTVSVLMILGVLNSLFFLPVMLSFVGPDWPMHKIIEKNNENLKIDVEEDLLPKNNNNVEELQMT